MRQVYTTSSCEYVLLSGFIHVENLCFIRCSKDFGPFGRKSVPLSAALGESIVVSLLILEVLLSMR